MAVTANMEVSAGPTYPSTLPMDHSTKHIAQAVAALLAPSIASIVEKAVQAGMDQTKKELGGHTSRLNEAEIRLSTIEDGRYQDQFTEQNQDKPNQFILQKLEDLENRLRLYNLQFEGVTESLQINLPLGFLCHRHSGSVRPHYHVHR